MGRCGRCVANDFQVRQTASLLYNKPSPAFPESDRPPMPACVGIKLSFIGPKSGRLLGF
jgi:hypothetical protein